MRRKFINSIFGTSAAFFFGIGLFTGLVFLFGWLGVVVFKDAEVGTAGAAFGVAMFAVLSLIIGVYWGSEDIEKEIRRAEDSAKRQFESEKAQLNLEREYAERIAAGEKYKTDVMKTALKEKSHGFPTLHESLALFDEKVDAHIAGSLVAKQRPAFRSAEVVKEETSRRRGAEKDARKYKALVEYYENIAPFLIEFKEQEIGDDEDIAATEYEEHERIDPVVNYMTKDEYRALSTTVRNQLALERYWKRQKSNKELGRMYERYVGSIFENKGYDVTYVGIHMGLEDLGRDLICRKGKETIIVQCKNWAHFKTIFEKHIFQLFGTVFAAREQYKNAKAVFYTTTVVSDVAKKLAEYLHIEVVENFKMDKNYACIKCNVSANGDRIYHLPFDQMYDKVKIEPHKGEFYAATIADAEKAGFRRAFRWQGDKSKAVV